MKFLFSCFFSSFPTRWRPVNDIFLSLAIYAARFTESRHEMADFGDFFCRRFNSFVVANFWSLTSALFFFIVSNRPTNHSMFVKINHKQQFHFTQFFFLVSVAQFFISLEFVEVAGPFNYFFWETRSWRMWRSVREVKQLKSASSLDTIWPLAMQLLHRLFCHATAKWGA